MWYSYNAEQCWKGENLPSPVYHVALTIRTDASYGGLQDNSAWSGLQYPGHPHSRWENMFNGEWYLLLLIRAIRYLYANISGYIGG